ncbi:hypothetical protein AB0K00_42645 [Dactylosporangium sp. NPDC049525]|uniref:hypothetical protein n=1 Tax=Dactylosporangium sp. NPDC049525 TaxID=3154730 RepID=UPI003413E459
MPEFSASHGVYRTSSDVIEVSGTWKQLLELQGWMKGRGPLTKPTDAHLRTYFTYIHEHMHRVDLMTTPFGLLLWRIDVTITTDARALVSHFGHPPAGTPLIEHCRRARSRIPVGPEEVHIQVWANRTVDELERLIRFRAHVWSRAPRGFVLGELVAEGNEVLDILRARFDLPTRWRFTTSSPNAPATVSVPYRRWFGTVDVLERSATIWERVALAAFENSWPPADQWWLDWRNAPSRYQDLGDLTDWNNLMAHRRLALDALSGPCDPALDLSADVPIEVALPATRWGTNQAAVADPLRRLDPLAPPVPGAADAVGVYEMLAGATLNGRYGLFGNAERAGDGAQATDPRRSYLAFVLRRFQDEFAQRIRIEAGLGSERQVPQLNSLVSLFDDVCVVRRTEVIGIDIGSDESGQLLLSLFIEHIHQAIAKYQVRGEALDIVWMWRRLRPMADRLVTDFKEALAKVSSVTNADQLFGVAVALYGKY